MGAYQGIEMKRWAVTVGVTIVVGLTLLSGLIQGTIRNRWGPPRSMVGAADKLKAIPAEFGNWRLQSRDEISERILSVLECAEYTLGTYQNQETGETVKMAVLLGPPGPMVVHTPEICFSTRDYSIQEKRERKQLPEGSDDEFWALTLQANDLNADRLRVYYAWSFGGSWQAPEESRFQFAGHPFLYKLQLASYLPPQGDVEAGDPCREFLKEFVPVVRACLAEASP